MKTYIIRDECGCETLVEGLAAAVRSIKGADWGDSPYHAGWATAIREVPEPKTDSADALNYYIEDLHKAAELAVLESSETDTHDWHQEDYEDHLANTSVPFRVEEASAA
jgi:hypothetical protein